MAKARRQKLLYNKKMRTSRVLLTQTRDLYELQTLRHTYTYENLSITQERQIRAVETKNGQVVQLLLSKID